MTPFITLFALTSAIASVRQKLLDREGHSNRKLDREGHAKVVIQATALAHLLASDVDRASYKHNEHCTALQETACAHSSDCVFLSEDATCQSLCFQDLPAAQCRQRSPHCFFVPASDDESGGHCAFKPPSCATMEPATCALSERCVVAQEKPGERKCLAKPCSAFHDRQAACVRTGRCMWEQRGGDAMIGEGNCSVINAVCEEHMDAGSCLDQQCRWNDVDKVCVEQTCEDWSNDLLGCSRKSQCLFQEDGTCLPRGDCDVEISVCDKIPHCKSRGLTCVPMDSKTVIEEMHEEQAKLIILGFLLAGTILSIILLVFAFKWVLKENDVIRKLVNTPTGGE